MPETGLETDEVGALELMAIAFLAALVIVLAVPILQGLGDPPIPGNPHTKTTSQSLDESFSKNFN